MLLEILGQAWAALRRNPTRSLLTMLGIVWGIVTVALLIAYGSGFRSVLLEAFQAFGKSAVICWPGQTSLQAGGERAGKSIRFQQADIEAIETEAPLVSDVCLETVRFVPVMYEQRLQQTAVRGVCPSYGEMRNEVAALGRWITPEDSIERRRVCFLGDRIKRKLFSGREALGETVRIQGVRFTVIGVMDLKMQMSNYFTSDDESIFIPYSVAGDLWDTRYASVMVFTPVAPQYEEAAKKQVLAAVAKRQRFNPNDERAIRMFGRGEGSAILDGITIGLQALLGFIGTLTLGIGGIGVMNIMLVSVTERTREIGLRRAIGARQWHIQMQILMETLVITLAGGVVGMTLAWLAGALIPPLPLLGALYEDADGRGSIELTVSILSMLVCAGVLLVIGVLSGLVPAMRAARLDPVEALRHE